MIKKKWKKILQSVLIASLYILASRGIAPGKNTYQDNAWQLLSAFFTRTGCQPAVQEEYDAAVTEIANYLQAEGVPMEQRVQEGAMEVIMEPDEALQELETFLGTDPLHIAAARGLSGLLKILLECGTFPHLEDRNFYGLTPLHAAIKFGTPETTRLLIEHGASVSSQDDADNTPLHYAVQKGDLTSVNRLLARGADASSVNAQRNSPLHVAKNKDIVASLMASLIQNKQTIIPTNSRGETPLTTALDNYILHKTPGVAGVIEYLVSFGVTPTSNDTEKLNELFPRWREEWFESRKENIREALEQHIGVQDIEKLITEFTLG